jgi:hypothetical protein
LAEEYWPAEQLVHVMETIAPITEEYWPAVQLRQAPALEAAVEEE